MAYRAPPGTSSSSNSLPARPPAPAGGSGFKPAFGTAGANGGGANAYSNATQYGPSSHYSSQTQYGASASGRYAPSTGQYGSSSSYPSYPGAPGTGVSSGSQGGYSSYPGHTQQQAPSYGIQTPAYGASYAAAPQIQNPFPAPGTGFDVSEAAQIAEWQSAYGAAPQLGKDGKPVATNATDSPRPDAAAAAAAANTNPDKKKTVVRSGGGKTWTDDSLLEWDPNHMRIFVGNLAGETTDESLLKAFSRWKSVQKARVIRDKRSTKSKGYGFVSFADADDFFQAAKEMNGKYIQSHPVVVKKANTDIKATSARDRGKGGYHNNKGGKNNKNKSGNQSGGGGGGYEPSLGPVPGAGVTKPGQKTKNGLRLLG